MRRISLTIITISLAAGVFLSSCKKGGADSGKFKPSLSTDTKCQIRIAGNYKNFEALEAEFDRFNKFYPQVELIYSYLDNYKSTIKSALASDSAPDIFMTFPWMLDRPDYKSLLEHAENLDDEKSLAFNLSTIRSQLICHTTDGQVPMLPVLSGSYGMLVNEDLFKKQGLSIPSTYKELIESCSILKEAGYKSPIMAFVDNFMGLPIVYSYFCKSVQENPEAIKLLNQLNPAAGQYLRPTLEWIDNFTRLKLIDFESCLNLKDKYNAVIMTFFEGNVPIMLCEADTVSGTLKRESQSEAFTNNPFKYSFRPFPTSNQANDFVNSVAVAFSVNRNSKNLEMTNEFMRFLIRTEELNKLAKIKRLITSSSDYSFDEIYAPLSQATPIYLNELGLTDNAIAQMRSAVYQLMMKKMTIEEAIANYGNL